MTDPDRLDDALAAWGHLHVELDSGAEYAISIGDTHIDADGYVVIDGIELQRTFHASAVEVYNKEPSHRVRGP